MKSLKFLLLVLLFSSLLACSKKVETNPFNDIQIGISPIFQADITVELLAGHLPQPRAYANTEELALISEILEKKINNLDREAIFLPESSIKSSKSRSRSGILEQWLDYGKGHSIDILLIPYLNHYNQKENDSEQNALMMDFFLLDMRNNGLVINRYLFAEQESSKDSDAVYTSFIKREKKTQMLEMVEDAIDSALIEFNLLKLSSSVEFYRTISK